MSSLPYLFPTAIEGYTSNAECRALYDLACAVPEHGVIVELGTYKGRSAVALAESGRHVFAVDRFEAEHLGFLPYPDHEAGDFSADLVYENARAYGVRVKVIEADTQVAARFWAATKKPPIDLLFIDAGHDYEQVKADAECWLPMVLDTGVVVFDDSLWDGVAQYLHELDGWTPIPGPQVGGLTAMKRCEVPYA